MSENLILREKGESTIMRSVVLCTATKYCSGDRGGLQGNKWILGFDGVTGWKQVTWVEGNIIMVFNE